MDNQNQTEMRNYDGVATDVDAVMAEQEAQRKAAQKDSIYRTIDNGKTAMLDLDLNVYKRTAQFDNGTSEKLGFELLETTPSGKNKVFEVGQKSEAARILIKIVKAAKLAGRTHQKVMVSRKGEKSDTRYTVSELEEGA